MSGATSSNLSIGSIGRAGKAVDLRASTEIECARFKPDFTEHGTRKQRSWSRSTGPTARCQTENQKTWRGDRPSYLVGSRSLLWNHVDFDWSQFDAIQSAESEPIVQQRSRHAAASLLSQQRTRQSSNLCRHRRDPRRCFCSRFFSQSQSDSLRLSHDPGSSFNWFVWCWISVEYLVVPQT